MKFPIATLALQISSAATMAPSDTISRRTSHLEIKQITWLTTKQSGHALEVIENPAEYDEMDNAIDRTDNSAWWGKKCDDAASEADITARWGKKRENVVDEIDNTAW